MAKGILLDAAGSISEDLFCPNCEYNLRGLPRKAKCPECGERIPRRLRRDLLKYADPVWVGSLAGGLDWIARGFVLSVLGGLLGLLVLLPVMMLGGGSGVLRTAVLVPLIILVALVISAAGHVLMLLGIWRFSQPDPATRNAHPQWRSRLPFLVAAGGTLSFLLMFPLGSLPRTAHVFYWLSEVLAVVAIVLVLARARNLVVRLPDTTLAFGLELAIIGVSLLALTAGVMRLLGYSRPMHKQAMGAAGFLVVILCASVTDLARRRMHKARKLAEEHASAAAIQA